MSTGNIVKFQHIPGDECEVKVLKESRCRQMLVSSKILNSVNDCGMHKFLISLIPDDGRAQRKFKFFVNYD